MKTTHRTLAVATAVTGVTLSADVTPDEVQAVRTAALGHPVTPHTVTKSDVVRGVRAALYGALPLLPSPDEALASAEMAAASAVAAYGPTVELGGDE